MLEPYIVLDFTDDRGELGPMLLGDLGADVIRIETSSGTSSRRCPPFTQANAQDLKSLQFIAFNRNKRSIVLVPNSPEDIKLLNKLIASADFIFESAPSKMLNEYGITFEQAKEINPRIVYCLISPFGSTGPYADYLGNDLVLAAMGGPVALQGTPDRAPLRISVPQVWRHAGVEAAAGAMVAHANMLRTGESQFVDLSAQSVMTWTMLNAMDAYAIQGFDFERGGSSLNTGAVKVEIVHPTSDGYIIALPMSSVAKGCIDWMKQDGVLVPAKDPNSVQQIDWEQIDWDQYDLNAIDPDYKPINLQQVVATLRLFFVKHSKQELFEFGLKQGITLAPINDLNELLDLQHLETRNYWRKITLSDNKSLRTPGLWAKTENKPLEVKREAPSLNQHGAEIRAELDESKTQKIYPSITTENPLPFDGINVADFAWVGVGPISAKYLADHGANVVRVESESRPDVLRGNGPFKDAEPGIDRSQFFGDFNTSKKSLTLDMKSPEGVEIAKKLIAKSDVFIESFAPGAISRMGLGYEQVSAINPGLIMISTCLMGQTGPAAGLAGYGYHAGAVAGFYEVIGWPDQPPSGPWIAYTDTVAPRFVSVLLAAALDHRRRTGEGCFIDVAQIETALHFLSPEILDLQVNDHLVTRNGNRSLSSAPQGCYRCSGDDNWCAIAIETDDQWQRLCEEMERTQWMTEPTMLSNQQRLKHHDLIDEAINHWTSSQDAATLMHRLQQAKIPAGVVQRSSDLLADKQYQHRGFYHHYDHQVMGNIPYAGHQYKISNYTNGPRGPAPVMGQHSYEVLSELLKLSDEDIASAFASGAIS